MEKFILNWELVQQFLYQNGITRKMVLKGEEQSQVSVFEHYGLDILVRNRYHLNIKNKKNYFIYWKERKDVLFPKEIQIEKSNYILHSINDTGIYFPKV